MSETQNFIETREHQSTDQPFDTVVFDLLPNSSFAGTVTIQAINQVSKRMTRKVVEVSGLCSENHIFFDGEIADGLRAQVFVANEKMKAVVWDQQGRLHQWKIVGDIDQVW